MSGFDFEGRPQGASQVAPLHITKSPSRTQSRNAQHMRQPSSRSRNTPSLPSTQAQMSPPLTPRGSREQLPAHKQRLHLQQTEAVFHHYLRAFYHFHPSTTVSSTGEESSITVPINQGDVILVHSIHPNGWADGTLLASGARGWLPTNYCSPYEHESIRSLLTALTHLWDLARSGEQSDLIAFTRQDYVRAMIAGARFLLDHCRCLNRDTPIVVGHAILRRMRKGLLGELSGFVKTAKTLQSVLQTETSLDDVFGLLDELVTKAFRVTTRAVRFLDIWLEDIESQYSADHIEEIARPLTPPTDTVDMHSVAPSTVVSPVDPVAREAADQASDPHAVSTVQPGTAVTTQSATHRTSRFSYASHRASYAASPAQRQNLASERLTSAQDAFLGCIGSFIGGHLQSRSPFDLLAITRQSYDAGRQLLLVVEEVWKRDFCRCDDLQSARSAMNDKLSELVAAAKAAVVSTDGSSSDEVYMPDEGKQLVSAATSCVRAAGDCVTRARNVVDRTGDFEFEQVGLGISEEAAETEEPQPAPVPIVSETQQSATDVDGDAHKPLPDPPKPSMAPPPPPLETNKPLPKPLPILPQANGLDSVIVESPTATSFRSSRSSIPPFTQLQIPHLPPPEFSPVSPHDPASPQSFGKTARIDSANDTTSSSTYPNSFHDDSITSNPSTRATTPDRSPVNAWGGPNVLTSFGSSSELQSTIDENEGLEEEVLGKTFAHELAYNKEGQITGGSLPALIEKLTTHESTPDASFVTTFYLTFRLFASPIDFAQALIDRFDYDGDSKEIGRPVRLRVYNVFKGWLESHWQPDADVAALGVIFNFATGRLRQALPTAGKRLAELAGKVTEYKLGAHVSPLVSSVGKTSTSLSVFSASDKDVPNPVVNKSQLTALRNALNGGPGVSIMDFDPLELARQFTLIESRLFCAIQPEELLASEWTKKSGSKAVNVRAMSTLSTDLANLVADTILNLEEPKKRAAVIKQWVKIAMKCLDLANYDSLMAIICSLNSSMVLRLKRTWEFVSQKTKNRLDELKTITDVSRNYAVLRSRLQNHVAPCIPFVGIYLTDLTFVDVGNQTTRQLPGDGCNAGASVINFDKHTRTAKIIGQLQGFQIPYRLTPVPEMLDWMEAQIRRVRHSEDANVHSYYRRSLLLEPREAQPAPRPSPVESTTSSFLPTPKENPREKFLHFHFPSSSGSIREKA